MKEHLAARDCGSPTSTSSVEVRLIAGSVPPPVAFDVQVTSSVTVAWSVNVPSDSPAEEVRYVCVQSLASSGSPARHAVPGPRQETLPPSPRLQVVATGVAFTVDQTRPVFAVAS
jgi:hypothetical protein